jgi:hypothetical protein
MSPADLSPEIIVVAEPFCPVKTKRESEVARRIKLCAQVSWEIQKKPAG